MTYSIKAEGAVHPVARLLRSFRNDESGATAIEYSLIVALIFLAIVGSVRAFTSSTSAMYDEISTTITDAGS